MVFQLWVSIDIQELQYLEMVRWEFIQNKWKIDADIYSINSIITEKNFKLTTKYFYGAATLDLISNISYPQYRPKLKHFKNMLNNYGKSP